ncbi:hypothetical protein EV178_002510 [Coemansia sp. RSA 1646]|nr:hypothetical protein EV178_002510 [Coemansia sp. RSA 1646]KAJ2091124.1 hypothetical protein IW138_002086 [Coemansia sp. RSA 986]
MPWLHRIFVPQSRSTICRATLFNPTVAVSWPINTSSNSSTVLPGKPPLIQRRGRHRWTAKEDQELLALVGQHGNKWALISKTMGIPDIIGYMNYRRRWDTLRYPGKGQWTVAENEKLHQVVTKLTTQPTIGGRQTHFKYGLWVKVAKELGTGRSPNTCFQKWRFSVKNIVARGSKQNKQQLPLACQRWSEEERERLTNAIYAAARCKNDTDVDIRGARDKEPWLFIDPPPEKGMGHVKHKYWDYISLIVRTRTAKQCQTQCYINRQYILRKRQHQRSDQEGYDICQQPSNEQTKDTEEEIRHHRTTASSLTITDIQTLARAVQKHGRKWTHIKDVYFPNVKECTTLVYWHAQWEWAERLFGVDLLTIDPLAMLLEYDAHKRTALRLTGPQGTYDPTSSGRPMVVSVNMHRSNPLIPYYLALSKIDPTKHGRQSGVLERTSVAERSPAITDQVVQTVQKHNGDWVAVSRELRLPAVVCYNIGKAVLRASPHSGLVDVSFFSESTRRVLKTSMKSKARHSR